MVKISELSNGAGIGGTEQVPVNDSGTTVKYTIDQILARTHTHTASQITDFNTAVDARIDVLTDTAKTTPVDTDVFALWDTVRKKVTRANIKATLKTYFDTLYHTKNALRTGLTASKALVTDGSGNEGYGDIAQMASNAEATAGTNETKYINPKQNYDTFYENALATTNGIYTVGAGSLVGASSDAEKNTVALSYTTLKTMTISRTGTYRFSFDLRAGNSGAGTPTVYGRLYKNGVAFGTERTVVPINGQVSYTEDLAVTAGDTIDLKGYTANAGTQCRVFNFRLLYGLTVNTTINGQGSKFSTVTLD